MAEINRVAWTEGLFMRAHHLQQADLFGEIQLHQRVRSLTPYDWGVIEVKVDKEALTNRRMSVTRLEAVLPHGMVVDAPDGDPLPPDREIPDLTGTSTSLEVFVGVPRLRGGVGNIRRLGGEANPFARFQEEIRDVHDLNTGAGGQMTVLRKNIQILFGDQPIADYDAVRVGVLRPNPAGGFQMDDRHIPPSLSLSSCDYFSLMLRRVLEMLVAKSESLFSEVSHGAGGRLNFGNDIGTYGLLSTCNTYIPRLAHFRNVERTHPERLYLELAGLTASLTSFHSKIRPSDILPYRHEDLSSSFQRIEELLSQLLTGIQRDKPYVDIPLERKDESHLMGKITSDRALGAGIQYILSARGDMDPEELMLKVPGMVKIGSVDKIHEIEAYGYGGLGILPEPSPPPAVPRRLDHLYFRLKIDGERGETEAWERIHGSRALALYVPSELSTVKFELFAVLE